MKKLLLTLAIVASATMSYAQGTLQFNNAIGTRFNTVATGSADAPTLMPAGSAINFGLFYGSSAGNLTLVPTLGTASPTANGFMVAPSGAAFQLVGGEVTAANTQFFVQVRAWSSSFGSNWQAAQTAFNNGEAGVAYAESAVVLSELLGASGGPGSSLWQATAVDPNRLTPLLISINPIPEPTTIALGILGAGSLLFLRRKK